MSVAYLERLLLLLLIRLDLDMCVRSPMYGMMTPSTSMEGMKQSSVLILSAFRSDFLLYGKELLPSKVGVAAEAVL